jgi:hypothetical protein
VASFSHVYASMHAANAASNGEILYWSITQTPKSGLALGVSKPMYG